MAKNPIIRKTDHGFQLGADDSNIIWWGWNLSQQTLAELWLMGIKCRPLKENATENKTNFFSVYVYADSVTDAMHIWENKMMPLLLAAELAKTGS